MKLGRISVAGPDGPVARLVRVLPEEGRVVDLARAEALRLRSRNAEPESARRLANAAFREACPRPSVSVTSCSRPPNSPPKAGQTMRRQIWLT